MNAAQAAELNRLRRRMIELDAELDVAYALRNARTEKRLAALGYDVKLHTPRRSDWEYPAIAVADGPELAPEPVSLDAPLRDGLIVRSFAVSAEVKGRTLDVRIAPYDRPARVADPPDYKPYFESFAPGAFADALKAPKRIMLDHAHNPRLRDVLGFATRLEDRADGLHGSFRLLDDPDGDKALELVREGVLAGVSAEFLPLKSRTRADGVVERLRVRLEKVALCRTGAYGDAKVLAVRGDGIGVLAAR